MHFDLAHAVVTVVLLLITQAVLKKFGIPEEGKRVDWRLVVTFAVVVFILNIVWPA